MTPRRLFRFAIGGTLGYVADAGTLEALVRLARDRGYAEALAQAGRELVATRYSWDASRQRWRQLLARWLEPGGSAAGKSPRAAELARRACRSAEG